MSYDPHDPGWTATTGDPENIEDEVVTLIRRREHPGEFTVIATAQEDIPAGAHMVIDPRTGYARMRREP